MYIMWGKYISYCSSSKDFQINARSKIYLSLLGNIYKYVFMDIEYAFDRTELLESKILFFIHLSIPQAIVIYFPAFF